MAPKPMKNNPPTTTTTTVAPASAADASGFSSVANASGLAGGVTAGYTPPAKSLFGNPATPYPYTNTDWQMLFSFPQEDVLKVQRYLMKAYPDFKPGIMGNPHDKKTLIFFKDALGRINQYNADPQDSLGTKGKDTLGALQVLGTVPQARTMGTTKALASQRVTSPTDLKAIFTKAAQESLGHGLGEGDINRMIEAYQAKEIGYQKDFAAGGVAVQNPDPTAFAQSKFKQDFGTEVNVQKMDNIFTAIDKAFSKGQ
jgi:hypothetical protein